MPRFCQFGEQEFVFRVVFKARKFLKLNLKDANDSDGLGYGLLVTAGQWSMCWSLCSYESVTPIACSWRSLAPPRKQDEKKLTFCPRTLSQLEQGDPRSRGTLVQSLRHPTGRGERGGGRAWTLRRPTACKTVSYQTDGYLRAWPRQSRSRYTCDYKPADASKFMSIFLCSA